MNKRQLIIAFHPELARQLGDVASAIFYQQLWYWGDKGDRKDGFIYKTQVQIEEETTLTRKQQDRIREKLINKKWLEVKKEKINGAPTLLYKPLISVELVIGNVPKGQMEMSQRDKSSITKITTKNEFSKENSSSLIEGSTTNNNIQEVFIGEDGEEVGTKKKRAYVTPQTKTINIYFRNLCQKHFGLKPELEVAKHGAKIKSALKILSEEDIYDLFDWWFNDPQQGKKDYDLIQITQALSNYNIDKYRLQHAK